MNWFFRAIGRYGEFSGRSRRKEYWWFVIISWVLLWVLAGGFFATSGDAVEGSTFNSAVVTTSGWAFLIAALAIGLILIIPHFAVSVRRMHDSGKSGAWVLFLFIIPLVVYILALLPGDATANRYGPDPISTDV
ncbi:DUF805 domain-containing protein [Demequina oxidasica]|uniref:DUF805 domain-containing protein n=1 Tax=Demequina oxidasica TaxID=676199 RepID=UPI0007834EF4|nr:DUF805 domain-containing protein [Demequina oxidasica]